MEENEIVDKNFRIKHLPKLFMETYKAWEKNDPWRMSAVVAYYAVLALPGLLVILINFVGNIWGSEIVAGQLNSQLTSALGVDAAESILEMIKDTQDAESNLISTIIGIATLIFGATGVFYQLQVSLNLIWKVDEISTFSFKKILTLPS